MSWLTGTVTEVTIVSKVAWLKVDPSKGPTVVSLQMWKLMVPSAPLN